jgi:hypothetical protein
LQSAKWRIPTAENVEGVYSRSEPGIARRCLAEQPKKRPRSCVVQQRGHYREAQTVVPMAIAM